MYTPAVITHLDPSAQPGASVIWMTMVKCGGNEDSVLDCPFGETEEAQDWRDHGIPDSGCNLARTVGLCCDVSQVVRLFPRPMRSRATCVRHLLSPPPLPALSLLPPHSQATYRPRPDYYYYYYYYYYYVPTRPPTFLAYSAETRTPPL